MAVGMEMECWFGWWAGLSSAGGARCTQKVERERLCFTVARSPVTAGWGGKARMMQARQYDGWAHVRKGARLPWRYTPNVIGGGRSWDEEIGTLTKARHQRTFWMDTEGQEQGSINRRSTNWVSSA
jgi:hypothetical protein